MGSCMGKEGHWLSNTSQFNLDILQSIFNGCPAKVTLKLGNIAIKGFNVLCFVQCEWGYFWGIGTGSLYTPFSY